MPAILIVDDDPQRLRSLGQPLQQCGHTVYQTQSVPTAFFMIHEQHPSAILLNLTMKDEEGVEAMCRLAEQLPPIVFHSPGANWPGHLPPFREGSLLIPTEKLEAAVRKLAEDEGRKQAELVPLLTNHSV